MDALNARFRLSAAGIAARAFLLLLLAGIALSSCSFQTASPEKYALVWGLNYAGRSASLRFCESDASDMAALLSDEGYVVRARLGSAASRAGLEADIAGFSGSMGPDDIFLFYYSGHGLAVPDDDARFPSALRGHEVLVPDDALSLSGIVTANLVADTDLASILRALPTARKVVILDACNSGGFIGSGAEASMDPEETAYGDDSPSPIDGVVIAKATEAYFSSWTAPADGIDSSEAIVLGASGAMEFSWEDTDHGHGIFTYYLLQAPQSGDLDGDGLVTALEAFWLARTAVVTRWNAALDPSSIAFFTPRVSGGPCDIVLFRSR